MEMCRKRPLNELRGCGHFCLAAGQGCSLHSSVLVNIRPAMGGKHASDY